LDTFKNKIFSNEIVITNTAVDLFGTDIEGFKTATFALTLETPVSAEVFLQQFSQNYTM
jgi:hypothetical protein